MNVSCKLQIARTYLAPFVRWRCRWSVDTSLDSPCGRSRRLCSHRCCPSGYALKSRYQTLRTSPPDPFPSWTSGGWLCTDWSGPALVAENTKLAFRDTTYRYTTGGFPVVPKFQRGISQVRLSGISHQLQTTEIGLFLSGKEGGGGRVRVQKSFKFGPHFPSYLHPQFSQISPTPLSFSGSLSSTQESRISLPESSWSRQSLIRTGVWPTAVRTKPTFPSKLAEGPSIFAQSRRNVSLTNGGRTPRLWRRMMPWYHDHFWQAVEHTALYCVTILQLRRRQAQWT